MTSTSGTTATPADASRRASRIAAIYVLVGLPYILLSDRLVDAMTHEPMTTAIQSVKGFAFVMATATLLFLLARRALRETAEVGERMAEAQQLGQVGSWTFDVAQERMEWSAEQARIHGGEDFDGRLATFFGLVHGADRARVERAWARAVEDGLPLDLEHRIEVEGDVRWVHLRGRPVAPRGKLLRLAGTTQDVTERRRAEDEAARARAGLQALAQHLTSLREDERQVLSRDVHDHLGQYIAALRVTLARLQRRELEAPTAEVVAEMATMVDELAREIRRIARALRPPVVDRRGLVPALRALVEETEERSPLAVDLETEPDRIELRPEQAVHVYRLCQEALSNVVRHAEASHAWLRLQQGDGALHLEVEDDGRGLVDPAKGDGLGLLSMGERVQLLGGQLELATGGDAGGLRVRVRVPTEEVAG